VRSRKRLRFFAILAVSGILCSEAILGQNRQASAGTPLTGKTEASSGHSTAVPLDFKVHPLTQANTPPSGPPITLLGSVTTASPAESFALSGTLAYVCDANEISVINISNPSSPQIVATAVSSLIKNSADINCAVQRNTLAVFSDQTSSTIGNSPGFVAFSLANPSQPALIAATSINKRFFGGALYIGNTAFVPTNAVTSCFGWCSQFGDLLAIDVTNFSAPVLLGTLEQPQIDPVYGGPNDVVGVTQANGSLLYIGGSSSVGANNNGFGWLQTVDASIPTAMKIVSQLQIPGTIQFSAPLIQGTIAVGIGNTGGYNVGATPNTTGNIVVATFDITDPRSPLLLSSTVTNYSVGVGGGAARIGSNLFAFAGVVDVNNNPVMLVVDATNPRAPVFESSYIAQPFTSMQAVGSTLYATLGTGGFAIYSIPGGTSPTTVCPSSIDAMLVIDQGANISPQGFLNAKVALSTFVGSLHLTPDQVGVVAFGSAASVLEKLTTNGAQSNLVVEGVVTGAGSSYIGGGIAAAQGELTSPRHVPSANQVMIVLSDGADKAAPNNSATITAANAAKAAGIRIISLQVGSGSGTLMQSIASSVSDYYVVPTP
jgi:hypothetical protein